MREVSKRKHLEQGELIRIAHRRRWWSLSEHHANRKGAVKVQPQPRRGRRIRARHRHLPPCDLLRLHPIEVRNSRADGVLGLVAEPVGSGQSPTHVYASGRRLTVGGKIGSSRIDEIPPLPAGDPGNLGRKKIACRIIDIGDAELEEGTGLIGRGAVRLQRAKWMQHSVTFPV